jgi:LysR family nitrogen assimilation transcriptional regulator
VEIRQFQYFVAVYEQRSVTQAALRLNIVQPALSQQISKLEDELGQVLFRRTPKGMVPTRAGEEAYVYFSSILRDIDTARRSIMDNSGQVSGSVSIGVVSSVANNALGEILVSFSKKFPDVEIKATGGYSNELMEMLRASQLDVIVINVPPLMNKRNMIDIVTEDLALISSVNTPNSFRGVVPLDVIKDLDLIIPSKRHGLRLIIDRAAAAENITLSPKHEVDEINTIEDLVSSTHFYTILPPVAVHRMLTRGTLVARPISPRIPRRLVYVTNPNHPLSSAAQLFIDEIREKMIDVSYETGLGLQSDGKKPSS